MYDAIINGAPIGVHQGGVLRLKNLEPRGVIRGDVIEERERLRTAELDLAHVAHVEQPGACPDRQVFLHDAGIFNRHLPAAEFHHLGAGRLVSRIQRRALQGDFNLSGHAIRSERKLRQIPRQRNIAPANGSRQRGFPSATHATHY